MTTVEKRERRIYRQAQVRSLFDSIAHRYDLLNHTLSTGIDILWRRRVVQLVQPLKPKHILDVATGTADLAIAAAKMNPEQIIGIDISENMLEIGRRKIQSKHLDHLISLEPGEAEQLRFDSGSFDVVMCAFGVRNFENLGRSLKEFHRVLNDDGIAVILEFSRPRRTPVKQLYRWYSKYIVPPLGGVISNNRMAYEYLPNTIAEFPDGSDLCAILRFVGFETAIYFPQTFGIVSIYVATKV